MKSLKKVILISVFYEHFYQVYNTWKNKQPLKNNGCLNIYLAAANAATAYLMISVT
jgi:hypothetical protein